MCLKSKLTDEGWYVCSARNEEGKISAHKIFLDVQFSVNIINITSPQEVPSGKFVSLLCNATGDPDPSIVWKTPNGTVIGPDHLGYRATGGFLYISSVSVETDAGDWRCEACNPIGCDNASVSLLIQGEPSIRAIETSRNTSTVTIRCIAIGQPVPSIGYLRRGSEISPGMEGHHVVGGVLYIKVSTLTDWYTCSATNKYGTTEQHLRKPKQPTKPLATEINSRNITLQWNSKAEAIFPSVFVVEHRHYDDTAETKWILDNVDRKSRNASVTNLKPYTKYVFRVKEKNTLGEGPESEVSDVYKTLATGSQQIYNYCYIVKAHKVMLIVKRYLLMFKYIFKKLIVLINKVLFKLP
ncbi:roundabout homolog 1-like [Gigantopelta aegis]|uniref:roundabout homolog 1-like n=1 Tax=Gigantopelta aegis TaxID=1735272 RepID=UPI001B88A6AE|nr:roundabout homolog 1-like [Gigantopelta aegis]